jgi:hypothetical protein
MTPPQSRSYTICTIDKHINCASCSIAGKVDCSRHNPEQMARFYRTVGLFVGPAVMLLSAATALSRIWWLVPGYVLYWIVYQVVGELFIRCRHCPFWDETSTTLECRINCRVPRPRWRILGPLVRYSPRPLAFWEKAVIQILSFGTFLVPMAAAAAIVLKYPPSRGLTDPWLIAMVVFAALQGAGAINLVRYLFGTLCPTCVHFSCPNNRQPFHIIQSYLNMNPYIREAWKKDLPKYAHRK